MILTTESSHKKLLVKAEKTVGSQLNDAESKIAEVQKVSQKQFFNLKRPYWSKSHLFVTPFCREHGRGWTA